MARWGTAQWGCFSLAGISCCLGLLINFAGHSDDQLKARGDKIFSDMLLLQIIFKFVFSALSCNMQNISRALCLWCPTAAREENVKTRGPVQSWTTGWQEKEWKLLVRKRQYKMILFYNIFWLEQEENEFEIELRCSFFLFFFFFPREGNEQSLEQNLPTVEGEFWLEIFKTRSDVFLNEIL